MRAAPIALALVTLSAATGAFAQGKVSAGRKLGDKLASPFRAERRTSITTINPAELPQGAAPAPLDDNKKPTTLPGTFQEATDVQFVASDAAAYARYKTSKTGSVYGRLDVVGGQGTVFLARDVQYNQYRGNQFSVNCSNDPSYGNYYRAMAIRWERVTTKPDGSAALEVSDGWFDGRSCKVFTEQRASIPLKPIVLHEGTPIVFAHRDTDGMTVYFPPNARVATDAGTSPTPMTVYGALWRVSVPIRKGSATSVLAEMNPNEVATWVQQLQGKVPEPRKANYTTPRMMQIGIDVLQTVRDPAPSILLRSTL